MTTRTRSTIINDETFPYSWTHVRNGVFQGTVTSNGSKNEVKSISDVVTPGYFSKVKAGEFLPINPYTVSTIWNEVTRPLEGETTLTTSDSFHSWSGKVDPRLLFTSVTDPTPSSSDIDHVVIKALSKAKAPEWDPLAFIGEFPKTVDLVRNQAERLFRLARRIKERAKRTELKRSRRQGRAFDPKRAMRDFNRLWLEGRYGWRPIVYDVQNIIAAYRNRASGGMEIAKAMHTVQVNSKSSQVYNVPTAQYSTEFSRVGSITYRAKVYYIDNMSALGGNPVISAWQLTRFSFIVDWFLDVSSWLQAVMPRSGYVEMGVSVSYSIESLDTYDTVQSGIGGWTTFGGDAQTTRRLRIHHREPYSGFPLPSIQVKLNPLKIYDLIALVTTGAIGVRDFTD